MNLGVVGDGGLQSADAQKANHLSAGFRPEQKQDDETIGRFGQDQRSNISSSPKWLGLHQGLSEEVNPLTTL